MSRKTQRNQPKADDTQDVVSRDMLEVYHNAQAQLHAAQVAAQFVTGQIASKYKLTAFDKVDLASGVITRGERPKGEEGAA
jgi:hypothetical protein